MTAELRRQRGLVLEYSGIQHDFPLRRILKWRDSLRPLVLAMHERRALGVRKRRFADLRPPGHAGTPARLKTTHAKDDFHQVRVPWRQPPGQPQLLLAVPGDGGCQRVERFVVHARLRTVVITPRPARRPVRTPPPARFPPRLDAPDFCSRQPLLCSKLPVVHRSNSAANAAPGGGIGLQSRRLRELPGLRLLVYELRPKLQHVLVRHIPAQSVSKAENIAAFDGAQLPRQPAVPPQQSGFDNPGVGNLTCILHQAAC